MPKFVIEREFPGAGKMSEQQLREISQTSCDVLTNMGPHIQWVQTYVTADKLYCIFHAPNEEYIMEHASFGGFPANKVNRVFSIIDPVTAE